MAVLTTIAAWYAVAALAVRFTPFVRGVGWLLDGLAANLSGYGAPAPVEFDRRAVGFIWLASPLLVPLVAACVALWVVTWAAGAVLMPRGRAGSVHTRGAEEQK